MKVYLKISFFILVAGMFSTAQAQDQNSIIKAQAMEMAKALIKKDYTTFSKYVHPKLIVLAGGTKKMIQRLDTANAAAKQFGAEIKHVNIGDPAKIISYKNELQTTLPQTTEMTTMMGGIFLESTLIAISDDKGKNWHFLDTSVYNVKDIKKAVPELSPELVIPVAKPPRLVPNKQ